mgnify:CR=1 FL=1
MIYIKCIIDGNGYDVMVDSGASHSYVPLSIVRANAWPVSDVISSKVRLPNGTLVELC